MMEREQRENTAPLVDTGTTSELVGLAGDAPEFIQTLYSLYESRAFEDREGMINALGRLDSAALARMAHSLKGASGNLGARKMESLCARIEVLARAGSLEETRPLVGETASCLEETRAALKIALFGA